MPPVHSIKSPCATCCLPCPITVAFDPWNNPINIHIVEWSGVVAHNVDKINNVASTFCCSLSPSGFEPSRLDSTWLDSNYAARLAAIATTAHSLLSFFSLPFPTLYTETVPVAPQSEEMKGKLQQPGSLFMLHLFKSSVPIVYTTHLLGKIKQNCHASEKLAHCVEIVYHSSDNVLHPFTTPEASSNRRSRSTHNNWRHIRTARVLRKGRCCLKKVFFNGSLYPF